MDQSIPLCLALTEKILGDNGAYRIHGGGFAGTILVFLPNNQVTKYKNETEKNFTIKDFEDVNVGILHWPLSAIRLQSTNKERIILLASRILDNWRNYSDESANIISHSKHEPHNTITPIARRRGGDFLNLI